MKPNIRPLFRSALIAALGSVGLTSGAHAATLYWDGASATVNTQSDNTTTTGQTWLSGGFWDNGTTSAARASWTAGDAAVFGGTAASQTITAGTFTVGNLTFGEGPLGAGTSGTAYTIAGGTITLSSSTITTNTNTSISSILAGTTGLIKAGAGTLTLSGANSFSGTTTVSAGTLALSGAGALNDATAVDLTGASSIFNISSITASSETIGSLKGVAGSSVVLGAKNLTTGGNNGTTDFAGVLSGTGGSLTKTGTGTMTLSGTNTYTGATTLTNGTLSVDATANLGDAASSLIFNGGTLQITGTALTSISTLGHAVTFNAAKAVGLDIAAAANTFTVNQVLNQTTGTFTKLGAGTVNLTQQNTYTGATTVSAGTLQVNNTTGFGLTSAVTVNSGATLGGTGSINALTTISSGGILAPGNSVGTLTTASLTLASGSILNFEFNGSPANDKIVVTANNGLTVNGGAFNLYAENTLSQASLVSASPYNLIQYTGAIGGVGVPLLSVANPKESTLYTFGTNGGWVTLTATTGISWTSGDVDDSNWMSGGNWGGTAPVAGDVLAFGAGARTTATNDFTAGTSFGGIVFNSSNTAAFTLGGNGISLTGSVVNYDTLSQTLNLNLALASGGGMFSTIGGDLAVGGVISGNETLVKNGAGTLTLTGVNTFSGGMTIVGGTLAIGGAGQLGSGNYASAIYNTATLAFNSSANQTLSGIISGTGALTKSDTGTLTLTGANTFSGITTVTSGTLQIGEGGTSGAPGSGGLAVNGGTLAFNRTDTPSFGGAITMNNGTISQLAASTVTLSGALTLNGAGALNSAADGTLTIGYSQIIFNGNTLTVGGAGDTVLNTWGANQSGTLTKTGSGTLTTMGAIRLKNSNVNIQGGVLSVQSGQLYGNEHSATGVITISGGGVLELQNWNYGDTYNLGRLQAGATAIVLDGGTIRMNNGSTATSYFRGFTVNAGGATLEANGSALWTLGYEVTAPAVFNNNALTFAGTGLGQFDKAFTGSGALTKSGTGTWTLTGANNHTGVTTIKGGTLKLTGGGGIASSPSIVVGDTGSSGAVLDVTGITGGTFTVGGSQTLSGIGTVNAAGKSVTVSGSIAPGNSAGLLSVSTDALQLASTSALSIEMTRGVAPAAGSNYDQLGLTGSLDLVSGASLNLIALGTGSWTLNDIYFLVVNDGNDAITGTFNGYVEGATILFDSQQFKVTYLADSGGNSFSGGNDLALQVIPEPGAALLGGLGMLALLRRRRF